MAVSLFTISSGMDGQAPHSLYRIADELKIHTQGDKLVAILRAIVPGIQLPETWESAAFAPESIWTRVPRYTHYHSSFRSFRFFYTKNGDLGYGPVKIAPGDEICVFQGCDTPVLLRKEDVGYIFVGVCLMIGFMDGEVTHMIQQGRLKAETFEIR